MLERCIEFLLLISPVALGSNRPVFWALNALVTTLAINAFVLGELRRKEPSRLDWSLLALAGAGLAIIVCWMALQALTCVPSILIHPIWKTDGLSGCGSISINPSLTWSTIAWMASVAIAIPAARLGTSGRRTFTVLKWLFGVAAAIALFGILTESYGFATLGLQGKKAYLGWVTGTFVNRNAAASYFGLGLIVGLTLLTAPGRNRGPRRSNLLLHLLHRLLGPDGFLCAGVVVLYGALLLTGSRAGIVASSIGALAVFALRSSLFTDSPGARRILASVMLAGFVALTAGPALLWRADTAVDSNISRLSLYREALRAIADRPLLGHGSGTYADVEPLYHASETPPELVWGHAHSVYLEAAATLGLPMTFFALALLGFVIFRLVQAYRQATADAPAIVAALSCTVALGLHSAVDFGLQTQAVAIAYSTLMGLAIGERMLIVYHNHPSTDAQSLPAGRAAEWAGRHRSS